MFCGVKQIKNIFTLLKRISNPNRFYPSHSRQRPFFAWAKRDTCVHTLAKGKISMTRVNYLTQNLLKSKALTTPPNTPTSWWQRSYCVSLFNHLFLLHYFYIAILTPDYFRYWPSQIYLVILSYRFIEVMSHRVGQRSDSIVQNQQVFVLKIKPNVYITTKTVDSFLYMILSKECVWTNVLMYVTKKNSLEFTHFKNLYFFQGKVRQYEYTLIGSGGPQASGDITPFQRL